MSYLTSLRFVINLRIEMRDAYAHIMFSDFTMPHVKVSHKHEIEKSTRGLQEKLKSDKQSEC